MFSETSNIKRHELECRCGCGLCCVHQTTVNMLQTARDLKEKYHPSNPSIRFNSGCRCRSWNQHEGGLPNSAHTPEDESNPVTYAVDIDFDDQMELCVLIACLSQAGFRRIGINWKKKFVHTDNDPSKPYDVWEY